MGENFLNYFFFLIYNHEQWTERKHSVHHNLINSCKVSSTIIDSWIKWYFVIIYCKSIQQHKCFIGFNFIPSSFQTLRSFCGLRGKQRTTHIGIGCNSHRNFHRNLLFLPSFMYILLGIKTLVGCKSFLLTNFLYFLSNINLLEKKNVDCFSPPWYPVRQSTTTARLYPMINIRSAKKIYTNSNVHTVNDKLSPVNKSTIFYLQMYSFKELSSSILKSFLINSIAEIQSHHCNAM